MVRTPPFQGENPGSNPSGAARNQKCHLGWRFLFLLAPHEDCARMSTARQVPFENAVFVGDSPQDMHGENADEQLANPKKRICLIEFLHLGLIIVCQGSGRAAKVQSTARSGVFC